MRKELGIADDVKVVIFNFGGQVDINYPGHFVFLYIDTLLHFVSLLMAASRMETEERLVA